MKVILESFRITKKEFIYRLVEAEWFLCGRYRKQYLLIYYLHKRTLVLLYIIIAYGCYNAPLLVYKKITINVT